MTDMTFDVPKGVSVAALVDGRIGGAIDAAVDETMRDIERDAKTRVRKGGKDEDRPTGSLLWAVWSHDTTRPLNDGTVDPQQHRHVTVLNMTYDTVEKRLKAVQLGDVVRDKGYFQAVYHARLSDKLKSLGYQIEKDGNSFRLEGVSKELCDKFSRRHQVIDAVAEARGIQSKDGRSQLAKLTRNPKGDELSTEELRQEWLSRMTPAERTEVELARRAIPKPTAFTPGAAVQYAIDHSFERESTTSERRLMATALTHGVGSVLPEAIQKAVKENRALIVMNRNGQDMVTTRSVLRDEIEMLKLAREGRGQTRPFTVHEEDIKHLDAEGRKAATQTLESRDMTVGIQGGAGTGKTTLLKTLRTSIERECGVVAFAQSSSASRGVLREAGFQDATTLAALFKSERMQKDVAGKVLLVDESSLNGTRDTLRVLQIAKRERARKVIFVGDSRQHHSVDAGDAMRLLQAEGGVRFAKLKTIRRQTVEEYRKAVEEISKGHVQRGFDMLNSAGAVVECPREERHQRVVDDYVRAIAEKKWDGRRWVTKDALIIAPTHREGDALTEELRARLKTDGLLGDRDQVLITRTATGWTEAQKTDARNYEKGMVVEFSQNAKGGFKKGEKAAVARVLAGEVEVLRQNGSVAFLPDASERFQVYRTHETKVARGERLRVTKNDLTLKMNNGDIVTVDSFTQAGDLRLSDGRTVPKGFGHISPGYVDTSYSSQGKSVDCVFIAAGDASVVAVNSQQWYVSVSRGRESAKIFVNDKEEIRDAIARSGQRLSAVELVRPKWDTEIPMRRTRVNEMLDRNRVTRYVRDRYEAVRDRFRGREVGVA
jgi:conjugative relaxase-like TrwC/TraI family protein